MTQPRISQFEVEDGVNEPFHIYIDRDADPGVTSFVLDQDGGADNVYITLDGLRALVLAAERLLKERGDA